MDSNKIKVLLQAAKESKQNLWQGDAQTISLAKRLVEGKVLIDRWGNLTTNIIFNPSHRDFVENKLCYNSGYGKNKDGSSHLWGADISFSEIISENIILLFSDSYDYSCTHSSDEEEIIDNQRKIALVPMLEHQENAVNSVKDNLQNIMCGITKLMKNLSPKDRILLGEQINLLNLEIKKL
jgi:hypothetical protein